MSSGREITRMRVLALAACSATAIGALALGGQTAYAVGPSEQRSYQGQVLSGTRAYAGATGTVTLLATSRLVKEVPNPLSGGAEYSVTIAFRGASCRAGRARRCLVLAGTLAGRAVREPRLVGDLPNADRLVSLSGRIGALGTVTARGRIVGTGFVARGRRALYVLLASAKGTVSIGASGPLVPGFQLP